MAETAKEQYDELVSALKKGKHTFDGRQVLEWAEYDGADSQEGMRIVAIQYGSRASGGAGAAGGVMREFAWPHGDLVEKPVEPEPEPDVDEDEPYEYDGTPNPNVTARKRGRPRKVES